MCGTPSRASSRRVDQWVVPSFGGFRVQLKIRASTCGVSTRAFDRRDPILPLSPGRAERHGFEYIRHGTLSLYAALETQTGAVIGKTAERHTSDEFVAFLEQIVSTQRRDREIHIIADNLSAHKTAKVLAFLEAHPNVQLHYTPTYTSWLNQV